MKPLIECVPNVSEGREINIIAQLAETIKGINGIMLLHTDIGNSANRTVFTFVGGPEVVIEAAFRIYRKANELIDMRQHSGIHPRIGAVDVCPLIPINGISMKEVNGFAHILAARVGKELNIPVYCYGYSAINKQRFNLEEIRRGEYEGLADKLTHKDWIPDYGPAKYIPSFGATVIGARDFLIAYNINLDTTDIDVAKTIAAEIRESGKVIALKTEGQNIKTRIPGKLKSVKAIGWYSDDHQCAQVSTNIIDYRVSSITKVFQTTSEIAYKYHIQVTGSEIIGLVPLKSVLSSETNNLDSVKIDQLLYNVENNLRLHLPQNLKLKNRIIEFLL